MPTMLSWAQHQVSPGAHGSLGRPSVQADRLPPDLLSPSGPPPHAHFRLSSVSHVFLWSTHVHVLSDPASFTLGPCRVAFLGPPFTGGYQSACETQLVRVSEGSSGPQGEAQTLARPCHPSAFLSSFPAPRWLPNTMACPPVSEGAALPRQTDPPFPAMQAPTRLRFS